MDPTIRADPRNVVMDLDSKATTIAATSRGTNHNSTRVRRQQS